jgi:hypothetical protein
VLREMIEKLKSGLESHEALYPVSPDDGKTPLVPATP